MNKEERRRHLLKIFCRHDWIPFTITEWYFNELQTETIFICRKCVKHKPEKIIHTDKQAAIRWLSQTQPKQGEIP